MPIYEYKPVSNSHCPNCAEGFEVLQKIADAPLTACPKCAAPVKRIVSAPNISSSGPSLAPANLEKHGFTQYRKTGPGSYEKTAGAGPETIEK